MLCEDLSQQARQTAGGQAASSAELTAAKEKLEAEIAARHDRREVRHVVRELVSANCGARKPSVFRRS